MSPSLLNPYILGLSEPSLPRTNMATNPRCISFNTNAKNELGPTTFYFHGSYSLIGSGGPSGGPASYVRKTLNVASPVPADTKINFMNNNPDVSNVSPGLACVDVSPSTTYMLSFWVRGSQACTPSVKVREYTSAGSSNGMPYLDWLTQSISAAIWTRVNVPITTSSTTGIISFNIGASDGTWANGNTWEITGVLFEQTPLLGTYFDGTSTGASWNGTVDESRSTKTS